MIRPLTIATCLLACGSGLYLYQSKHEVEMLDRTIEKTVHDTNAMREQSRLLAAEWTMLNDPQRLQQFASSYLSLKPIAPSQFTSLADLDSRLPAPVPAAPPSEAPQQGSGEQDLAPVTAEATQTGEPEAAAPADVAANEDMPVPPIPAVSAAPVIASVSRPADTRGTDRAQAAHPVAADGQPRSVAVADARAYDQRAYDQRPPEQRQAGQRGPEQRVAEARVETRTQGAPPRPIVLAAPRPSPVYAPVPQQAYRPPVAAGPAPYGGSLLGMARGSMPPAPRPTPVNTAYDAN
jgi:hypothetical protein